MSVPAQSIEAFIPWYPDLSEPDFTYQISRKKEFNDLYLEKSEPIPETGELLQTQLFMKRFFALETPYTSALLFHGLGTGKCVHPDTTIHTDKGDFTAEKIWNMYNSDLRFDDGEGIWSITKEKICVTSYDEKINKLISSRIRHLYRQPVYENLVRLRLDNGFEITMTQRHRLYDGSRWTNIFEEGDYIYLPNPNPEKECLTYARIINKELIQYQGFVYDFEIEMYHNYVANGILCHNSCVASAIIENFKNSEVGGLPRKPALVIVKSEDLARNIAQEIANRCTSEIYTPKPTLIEIKKGVELTEETKIARLNRAIAKTYEIVPVETLLRNLPSKEEIIRKYSDRVVIFDEAHILRIQPARTKKAGFKATIEEIVDEQTELELEQELEEGEKKPPKKKDITAMLYTQMHYFLHLLNGRKLLLTGTPIWDKPSEIASLVNFILPEDEQLETRSDFDAKFFNEDGTLNEDNIGELREKFRGRVSFLRQMMTTAQRIEMGTKEPWLKHITVFPDGMSETQAAVAREARDAIESKTIKIKGKMVEREVKGGTVLKLARDAMNMVIPTFDSSGNVTGVEYGPEAFRKYVIKEVKKKGARGQITSVKTYDIDPRSYLAREIRNNLWEYAAKFASIIEDVKSHPNEVIFIYNEEVTGPGGAIMLGLCLQIHGLIWAKNASDISRTGNARRFVVITSDPQTTSQSKQVQEMIASSNNDGKFSTLPSNKYADRLQVIIGSEKIALGLSIKNVRRVHIVMPHWNTPSISQAEARGFRFGSHDALKPEERVIRIFRHISVETPEGKEIGYAKGQGYPADASFTDYETTDVYIYRIAEEKEFKNSQIYRILKEEAFDCAAFYKRNVLDTDIPYTRDCDYQECNYECDGFPPVSKKGKVWDYSIPAERLDYSSYNLFYSSGRLKEIIAAVVELFNSHFSLLIDTAQQLLEISDDEKDLLLQAIDIIINSRTLIRNRYGFGSYLKESGNMLFLDSTVSPSANYPESTYIENPLVSEITSLDSLVEIFELDQDIENVLEFCRDPSKAKLDTIAYKTKILLLETAYISSLSPETKRQKAATKFILDELKDYIYEMSDGTPVHILYSEEFKGPAYAVAAKDIKVTGTMRKYDDATKKWTYVDPRQEERYIAEIRSRLTGQRRVGFEDNPYGAFGWISKKDGSFRINIKPAPGKKHVRGRKCENFQIPDLVDIFIEHLKYFPEPRQEYQDIDREELVKMIKGTPKFSKIKKSLDMYDDDQLRSILTLMTHRIEGLCELLMEWFENNDLLFSM